MKTDMKFSMLLDLIRQAWEGRKVWLRIDGAYHVSDNKYLLIMPDDDLPLNRSALKSLAGFLEFCHMRGAVVVHVSQLQGFYSEGDNKKFPVAFVSLSQVDMDNLLKYYLFRQFYIFTKVISLKEPYGSDGLLKAGKADVDMDYFVNVYFFGTGAGL